MECKKVVARGTQTLYDSARDIGANINQYFKKIALNGGNINRDFLIDIEDVPDNILSEIIDIIKNEIGDNFDKIKIEFV